MKTTAKEQFGHLINTCECCEKKDGIWTQNPYDSDVKNECNMMFICLECFDELLMEI
jgi:hypothetical protein